MRRYMRFKDGRCCSHDIHSTTGGWFRFRHTVATIILLASHAATKAEEATTPIAQANGIDAPSSAAVTAQLPSDPYGKFDALSEKGWGIPFPRIGDTVLQDAGGFRSALANAGFGFLALSLNSFGYNLLGGQRGGPQYFNGQKATQTDLQQILVSYDLSRLGIPNAQINAALVNDVVSWAPLGPRTRVGLGRLNYYQSFFNKLIELKTATSPRTSSLRAFSSAEVSRTEHSDPPRSFHSRLG